MTGRATFVKTVPVELEKRSFDPSRVEVHRHRGRLYHVTPPWKCDVRKPASNYVLVVSRGRPYGVNVTRDRLYFVNRAASTGRWYKGGAADMANSFEDLLAYYGYEIDVIAEAVQREKRKERRRA